MTQVRPLEPASAEPGPHVPGLAHHFDDLGQQHEAAMLGMWAFLATEVMFFGGALAAYAVYRSTYFEAFAHASNEENWVIGAVNTTALLTSSLTVALAVHAAQHRQSRRVIRFLAATIALGLVFLLIKVYEYTHIIQHHLAPWSPYFQFEPVELAGGALIFFSFYFTLTGIHALHMVIGIGVMLWLIWLARRGRFETGNANAVEMAGLYWHFVDIVWIFLYPLLYLVHRS